MKDLGDFNNKPLLDGILGSLGQALQLDFASVHHTDEHTVRVAIISAGIASCIGRPSKESITIGLAGYYHDLGKTNREIRALVKSPRQLSEEELLRVRRVHTDAGGLLIYTELSGWYDRETVWHLSAGAFLHHHMYSGEEVSETAASCLYPGSPQPLRLSGKDIPLAARIVAVADVFDAITGGNEGVTRPYQDRAFSFEEAISVVAGHSGNLLDPEIVSVLDTYVRYRLPIRPRQFLENRA